MLHQINTNADLLRVVYNADPGTYVNSFNSAFGDSAVTGAIVAVPELSYLSFTSRAFTRTGIDIHVLLGGGTVLKYRNFSLAEHDIYGSSRLGIRSYYPKQIGLAYDDARKYYDTVRLWNPVPWYSLEYQDVVKTDSMNLYGNAHRDPFITQLVTGTKQYEITDHLGNVLTTVSDKRAANSYTVGSLASGTSIDTIATRKQVVVSAYDYYPFGQYMPGRFTEDSGSYCFTTTLTEMVTTMTMAPLQVHLYGRLSNGGASPVVTPSDNGGILVTSTEAGTGVSWPLNDGGSEPGTPGEITLVTAVSAGVFTASVVEDGTGSVRGSINLYSTQGVSTSVVLPYTHTGSSTGVSIHIVRADVGLGGDYSTHISTILVPTYTTTPQNVVSTVCNGENYRYGYNGQLKDNEWAGKGNHNTALFWEYDTRTGRRANLDPVSSSWESQYATFKNNPIMFCDPLGDYSKLGAWWRNKVDGGSGIYKSGKDWGYNTIKDGEIVSHFRNPPQSGPTPGSFSNWYKYNGKNYSNPNEALRAWQDSPFEISGETDFERRMRFAASAVHDSKTDMAGSMSYGGFGGLNKVAAAAVKAEEAIAAVEETVVTTTTAGKTALVTANRAAGNAYRDEVAAGIAAEGRQVATEVYKWTPFGARFIDIEVSQGGRILGGIETKVGKSPYTYLQKLKDLWLEKVQGYPVNLVRQPKTKP